ncbi:ATP synthase F1 subunit gamma [Candidatus Gracilibacteria bacterium]|nr:ATP synthase F1 subunit gamma [Candidatus Gracilibacteria bacterium]
MANAKEIKRKIGSIKNTSQITGAMELISTVKMKKAQDLALGKQDFVLEILKMFMHLEKSFVDFPLFTKKEGKKTLGVIVTSNKGLCGGYNINVLKKVNQYVEESGDDVEFITIGKKAAQFVAQTGNTLLADFSENFSDKIEAFFTKGVVDMMMTEFLSGKYKKVKVFYNFYASPIKQIPVARSFLPISKDGIKEYLKKIAAKHFDIDAEMKKIEELSEYEIEPSKALLAEKILPIVIHMMFFDIMLEAKASEHSSRMIAMKNAKESANKIADNLTLEYNKARQAMITREVSEITAGVESMKDV